MYLDRLHVEAVMKAVKVICIPVRRRSRTCPGMNGLSGTVILPTSRDKLPHTSHPEDAQHLKNGSGCPPATPDARHGGQGIPNKRCHPGETVDGAPCAFKAHAWGCTRSAVSTIPNRSRELCGEPSGKARLFAVCHIFMDDPAFGSFVQSR
jgi:hypothetical protein